jgi:nucleoid-associated protein YgaU
MKNFSTGVARPLLARAIAAAALASALATSMVAPAQAAPECRFRPNAPDEHKVVKGDTLWDISGAFLEHPWCWPQVWGMNREEIRNPHWIYPGQIIYFDRRHGRLTLVKPGADTDAAQPPLTRLSPQLRTEDQGGANAVPSIPSSVIEPFLTQPLVVEADTLAGAARIVASQEDRIYLGDGDRIYVRGDLQGATAFQVFRPGNALRDPDTGKVVAHEAAYIGTARLVAAAKPGVDVHSAVITGSVKEMAVGDRLLPMPPVPVRNYAPHAPTRPVGARVMSLSSESSYAVQNQIVTVNRGELDGLDVGAVLQLYHVGQTVTDPEHQGFLGLGKKELRLPDEQYGELFIFRVFGHVSYGLVMQVTAPVQVGDVAKSPE